MNTKTDIKKSKTGSYLVLIVLFAACVWVGWQDFDPRIPQEVVRENIRSGIRGTIQLAIQYFIPINILVYFAQEIIARKQVKQTQEGLNVPP
jgi:hypothetical protein